MNVLSWIKVIYSGMRKAKWRAVLKRENPHAIAPTA
jgi:hypothetical protein